MLLAAVAWVRFTSQNSTRLYTRLGFGAEEHHALRWKSSCSPCVATRLLLVVMRQASLVCS